MRLCSCAKPREPDMQECRRLIPLAWRTLGRVVSGEKGEEMRGEHRGFRGLYILFLALVALTWPFSF